MISVQITNQQSVGFLTEIFSNSTKIQICNTDCTSINEEQLHWAIQTIYDPLYKMTA